jgi:hypothetical protein
MSGHSPHEQRVTAITAGTAVTVITGWPFATITAITASAPSPSVWAASVWATPRGCPKSSRSSILDHDETTTRPHTSAVGADTVDAEPAPPSRQLDLRRRHGEANQVPSQGFQRHNRHRKDVTHSLAGHRPCDDQTPGSPVVRPGARLPHGRREVLVELRCKAGNRRPRASALRSQPLSHLAPISVPAPSGLSRRN